MKTSVSCLVSILGLLAACSGGSGTGSADLTAPSIVLTFPPPLSFTDADSITVTGTASDPSGVVSHVSPPSRELSSGNRTPGLASAAERSKTAAKERLA